MDILLDKRSRSHAYVVELKASDHLHIHIDASWEPRRTRCSVLTTSRSLRRPPACKDTTMKAGTTRRLSVAPSPVPVRLRNCNCNEAYRHHLRWVPDRCIVCF